jgi:hypothetical protein
MDLCLLKKNDEKMACQIELKQESSVYFRLLKACQVFDQK